MFDAPSRQNLTFQMVGKEELPNAVALNSSLFNLARIFGPAVAGVVIAVVGTGWCFAINTVSFLAVLAALLAMRVADLYPLAGRRRPTVWRGTREGLAYARHNLTVQVTLAMMAVFASLCFNFNILLPLLAKNTLDAGPRTFGIISAAFGAGALVGALSAAAVANARWRTMLLGAGGFGICELLIAPVHGVVAASILLFVCGVFFTSYTANVERVDPARKPRPPPGPRPRPLLLRLERPRTARRPARRLALRPRRDRARIRRRRHLRDRDDRLRRGRRSLARAAASSLAS